ncbi:hypothetical protein RUND412_001857 [Rhizina undulata]
MGASLWLLPPAGSEIEAKLSELINGTIPPRFAAHETVPNFPPHITLTSEVPVDLDPQAVVDGIDVGDLPEVVLKSFVIGETFFTRGTLHAEKTPSLTALTLSCRQTHAFGGQSFDEAEKWLTQSWTPHLSLVYANVFPVPAEIVDGVEADIRDAGIELRKDGWVGGKIVLVSCSKPIEEWVTLAERDL